MQARETQIIMQSFAFRACASSTESRWSGMPSSTGRLAGAAGALPAGRQHSDAGFLGGIEDRSFRRDGEGQPALGEVDLDGLVEHGLGEGLGDEPLDVQ